MSHRAAPPSPPARPAAAEAIVRAAQAVCRPGGTELFGDLVRELADILGAATAFVAVVTDDSRAELRTLAAVLDGRPLVDFQDLPEVFPCARTVDQTYRHVASGAAAEFPPGSIFAAHGMDSYAALPIIDSAGAPLGLLVAMDRKEMADPTLTEAVLRIFAVRAAAEIERLRASDALERAAASYRRVFDATEDGILVQDGQSGAVLDANRRACEMFGYSWEELRRRPVADIASGIAPFTEEGVLGCLRLARLDRCPPVEWQRRNRDGSLHWDEVRFKPAFIDRQPRVLAFMREITERKAAMATLASREEQYRAIFETSSDGFILWDEELRVVDANPAALRMYGYERHRIVGRGLAKGLPPAYVHEWLGLVRRAMAGETVEVETRGLRADGSAFDVDLRVLPFRHRGQPHVLAVARDIGERRERERALLRSEARLRATIEAALDAIVGMDGEGRIVEFNAAAERVFGHRRDDVLGHPVQIIIPPRDREGHARGLEQFHRTGRRSMLGRLVETCALRADGSEFPIELAISVAATPEGSIFVGHLRDITERRRADQSLRDSEAQYRGIFNASADALVLRDAAFRIVDVNATYETMSGYSRDEVIGLDRVLANPAHIKAVIRGLHERALAGEQVALQTELVRRDGTRYELELRGVPVLHRGEPHVLYIGRDVTIAKRAEEALRSSEEQYRAIFNASTDALVLRDSDYRAVDVNPAYLAMSGHSRDEVLGSPWVLSRPDPQAHALHLERHARIMAGERMRFEVAGTRKDGSRFHAEVSGMPVRHRGELHVLYAARDISERREAEARREELERQLRQAQKMEAIGQLTGGIAHDFNNILTSVIGYLVLGEERAARLDDAALQRQLGQAHLAAQRARDLIAQMLAFARRQRGEQRTLSAVPLVRQMLQLLRSTLPASVAVDFAAPAPGRRDDEFAVVADVVQMEQVLFNLCINARDAIEGPGAIRVRVARGTGGWNCASCRAPVHGGTWVEVSVADTGSGIAPEMLERMFEPFVSSKEVGRGSGMGLAMVHGIVHDHGGHVAVETRLGKGSVFRVMLPAADAQAPAHGEAAPALAAPVTGGPLEGHVLIVEDEPMVGDFVVELLEGWGLSVSLQRDPLQALRWLEDTRPGVDLVLTDHTMPQMTGLELARRIRACRPGLPVVLYTGDTGAIDEADLASHGVRALLRKPIDAAVLRALVQHCLARPDVEGAA